jgi:hypothetical protein
VVLRTCAKLPLHLAVALIGAARAQRCRQLHMQLVLNCGTELTVARPLDRSLVVSQSYSRRDAFDGGSECDPGSDLICAECEYCEMNDEGEPYGCSDEEWAIAKSSGSGDCEAGGWGFTLLGIVGIFYSLAMLHTVLFGCLTWMRRQEAPPATHGLGPKGNPAVAVRLSPPPLCLASR